MVPAFAETYNGTVVERFSPGSVIVDFYSKFNIPPVASTDVPVADTRRTFSELLTMETADNRLGNLNIVDGSLSVANVAFEGDATFYRSGVKKAWRGGFIGYIDVWPSKDTNGWAMAFNFRRKIFEFKILDCDAKHIYTSPNRRHFAVVNTDRSYDLPANKKFRVQFIAKTYQKLKGLDATVDFYHQRLET
ncbi:uncharacterized protein [Amphiura filiformis]|uniref:uncharacterized protein n=1 Tax=Amphiura filiformis TaxID=82378 RepID=UPI003B214C8A